MGKPKKGKKGGQENEFSDDDNDLDRPAQADLEEVTVASKPTVKKSKKFKKKKDDYWEDDVAEDIEGLSLENKTNNLSGEEEEPQIQVKSKKKDKKKKKKAESDDERDNEDIPVITKSKSKKPTVASFACLSMDDSDEDLGRSSEGDQSEEEIAQPVLNKKDKKKTKKQSSVECDDDIMDDLEQMEEKKQTDENQTQQKKKGKKQKKKNKAEDVDIDAILAEIESKTAPATGIDYKDMASMTPDQIAAAMEAEYSDDDDQKKNKKNKKPAKQEEENKDVTVEETVEVKADDNDECEDEDTGDASMKTAAQKKREKKERQKQKKLEETAKARKGGKQKQDSIEAEEKADDKQAEVQSQGGADALLGDEAKGEDKDGEEEEDSKKKKKKDKKKKEKEEPKKKTSKMAQMILEQQRKIKEEEERLRLEEEETERKIEEARQAKEEEERLVKEKKEQRKKEKADRIAKQKKEGTYMTPKEREQKRIALERIAQMGTLQLPNTNAAVNKKRPVYDNRKKNKKVEKQDSTETKETGQEVPKPEAAPPTLEVEEAKPEEDAAAWDASDNDVKDDWAAESSDESQGEETKVEETKVETKALEKKVEKQADKDVADESKEASSDEESSEESSSEEEDDRTVAEKARDKAERRIAKRKEDAEKAISVDKLRAAVVCVLGHVDTGKTKILDKLRRTNVQDNEAGGITQQIGATNVPVSAIKEQTKMCKDFAKKELKLPGLLIIDTPGHESFSNLRTRGSSLCDIAILVVDIMHGLEPQTIESINLLRERKCPFVVALNKVDRLYQWQSNPHTDIVNQLKKQKPNTKLEFEERVDHVKLQFSEQGLNVSLFHENPNPKEYISMVPTSAHSGDGMGNLITLICELTQSYLAKEVAYSPLLQATVMEVKAIPGLGTTIDVILVNGSLHEGQTIIVPGSEGPIVTQIRGLLMPQPMKELRVKGAYDRVKELVAAQGVKIIGKDLEKALAGLPMHVAYYPDEVDIYREELEEALTEILNAIKLQEKGVFVQASTLGSLEALLNFLQDSKIPYAGINIGPVHRKDVMRASVMLERDVQYAAVLAFDVKVEREAQEMADSLGIRIFTADIIYHLFDAFIKYREDYKKKKQDEFKHLAVFPCKLRILPQYIFNSRDPIVMGVIVESGFIKVGTPVCVPSKEFCYVGVVTSLEVNHKQVEKAIKGQELCIKIENVPGETPKLYGRHFDENDLLISKISRASIDAVKDWFRDEMTKAEWDLIRELKKLFEIL